MDFGIIGGADGPTAIFVSGPAIRDILLGAALVLLIAGLIIYAVKRKQTK